MAQPGDTDPGGTPGEDQERDPVERLLAGGFDRLAPQGSPAWHTDDTIRRVDDVHDAADRLLGHATGMLARLNPYADGELDAGIVRIRPWADVKGATKGLAGRRRFGPASALSSLADALAGDSRSVTGDVAAALVAMIRDADRQLVELAAETSAAVSSLASRVEWLEARTRIVDEVFPARPVGEGTPDLSAAAGALASWFPTPEAEGTVLHADAGDGSVLRALTGGLDPVTWPVVAGDPRAEWLVPEAGSGPADVRLASAAELVSAAARRSLGGVVLAGCLDQGPLADGLLLVSDACGALAPGGRMALLVPRAGGTIGPVAWAGALAAFGLRDVRVADAPTGAVAAVTGVAW